MVWSATRVFAPPNLAGFENGRGSRHGAKPLLHGGGVHNWENDHGSDERTEAGPSVTRCLRVRHRADACTYRSCFHIGNSARSRCGCSLGQLGLVAKDCEPHSSLHTHVAPRRVCHRLFGRSGNQKPRSAGSLTPACGRRHCRGAGVSEAPPRLGLAWQSTTYSRGRAKLATTEQEARTPSSRPPVGRRSGAAMEMAAHARQAVGVATGLKAIPVGLGPRALPPKTGSGLHRVGMSLIDVRLGSGASAPLLFPP